MRCFHSDCLDLKHLTLCKLFCSVFTSPVAVLSLIVVLCLGLWSLNLCMCVQLIIFSYNLEHTPLQISGDFSFSYSALSCFSLFELWTLFLYLLCLAWVCPPVLSNRPLQVESPDYFNVQLICFPSFMDLHPWVLVQCLKIAVSWFFFS